MEPTRNFSTQEKLVLFLREMTDGREDEDWGWQEGFCCGLNEAGILTDKELTMTIDAMKEVI